MARKNLSFLTYRATSLKERGKNLIRIVEKRPLLSFFLALGFLLVVIAASNFLFAEESQTVEESKEPKEVRVYRLGGNPRLTFQAQIEKSGVIKIMAQTAGVVERVNVKEGQKVGRGANLMQISATYQGGNPAAIQASIAAKQYQLAKDTFDDQKDLINKQKEVATQTNENTQQLSDISQESVTETRDLLNFNQQILDSLNANLRQLEQTNVNDVNASTILQTKQAISQLTAGQNQIRTQLRSLEYQTNEENPPAKLADLQKEITLKQLDLQEKTLENNKELARLQLSLANLSASFYHPVSPFAGTIDRIYVRAGQSVNPGTTLFSLSGQKRTLTAIALVPQEIAKRVSRLDPSLVSLNGQTVEVFPSYVSTEATNGQLYSVLYHLPNASLDQVANESFVNIEIPLSEDKQELINYIPLDAVYQTEDETIVYVVSEDKAQSKQIKLGNVSGSFVEVLEGLESKEQIILDRNIVEGDLVTVLQN